MLKLNSGLIHGKKRDMIAKSRIGKFTISKEENDPLCLRVSMGGTEQDGYYIVFRGDPAEIESMLTQAAETFKIAANKYKSQNN